MIQTGVAEFGPRTQGWSLNTGTGLRSFRSPDIGFQPPFPAPPKMALALSGIDSDRATNLRVIVEPYDVEADEFNILVRTWDDTVLHSVLVTWIACD
jgi:hypothetical protein